MAQRVDIVLVDDIDGSSAAETISFSLEGISYEIDLSTENAAKLRRDFDEWVQSARRVGGRKQAAKAALGRSRTSSRNNNDEVRAWARANGYDVKERGRVPAAVLEAYEAAN